MQVIAWKDSSLKWPVMCWVGRQALNYSLMAHTLFVNCVVFRRTLLRWKCRWIRDITDISCHARRTSCDRLPTSVAECRLCFHVSDQRATKWCWKELSNVSTLRDSAYWILWLTLYVFILLLLLGQPQILPVDIFPHWTIPLRFFHFSFPWPRWYHCVVLLLHILQQFYM